MRPAWASAVAGAVVLAIWILLAWAMAPGGAGSPAVEAMATAVVVLGLPYVAAAAVLAHRVAGAARGSDVAARVLAVATAGRAADDWGAAMRAELAHIDDAADRRRFAFGCAAAAVRADVARASRVVAPVAFVAFAAVTLVASRVMLAGDRTGMLAGLYVVVLAVFAAGLAAGYARRSFRAGLVSGYLTLAAGLAGVLAVAAVEAVTWYYTAGVFIIDGDYPKNGIAGPGAAIGDALTGMTFFVLLSAAPWPLIGAALGAIRRRTAARRRPAGGPERSRVTRPVRRGVRRGIVVRSP